MLIGASRLHHLEAPGGGLDAEELEAAYAHEPGTVRANFSVTLDGAVELDGRSGGLGGDADRDLLAALRALADVVLVGAGTVRAEGYGPVWVRASRRQRRVARGQAPLPTLAVVSGTADLDPGARLFVERREGQPVPPRPVVLTCLAAPAERRRRLADVADVRVVGDGEVDLAAALVGLRADCASPEEARILTEGGPRLLGDLLTAGLLDELCLTHSPFVAGPDRVRLCQGWRPTPDPGQRRFRLEAVHAADDRLFTRYRLLRGEG